MLLCVGSTVVASWARPPECAWVTEAHRHLAHSAPCPSVAVGVTTSKADFVPGSGGAGAAQAEADGPGKKAHGRGARDPEPAVGSMAPKGRRLPKGRGGVEAA